MDSKRLQMILIDNELKFNNMIFNIYCYVNEKSNKGVPNITT